MSELDDLFETLVPGAGRAHGQAADAPAVPTALGLERPVLLGQGRTGWVWRATDPVLGREVAVKIARPERGAEAREELLREAQRGAVLSHPARLAVHRIVVVDHLLCVVRQLAPEGHLDRLLDTWRADPDAAWPRWRRLRLLQALAEVLAHAHGHGQVHGDLHGGQIALEGDRPYVLDWGGLAHAVGGFAGTPELAAPEQLSGGPPSAAADVFSLCGLAHELLTLRALRPPRPRDAVGTWLATLADHPVPPPIEGLPEALAAALHAGLSADPGARPAADALAAELSRTLTGRADRQRRQRLAREHLDRCAELLGAFEVRERDLQAEHAVVAVQRAKVPTWASPDDKRSLWSAEDRVLDLLDAQAGTWTFAIEEAVRATGLDPDGTEAHRYLAQLWWERWLMAHQRGYLGEEMLTAQRVRLYDDGTYARRLDARARLTVRGEGTVYTVRRARRTWSLQRRADTPCEGLALPAGPYVVVTRGPDGDTRTSLDLQAHEHAVIDVVAPPCPDPGLAWVPPGTFRMGGDPEALGAVQPCRPHVDGFFIDRHPVTAGAWAAWLATLPVEEARRHLPRSQAPYQGTVTLWSLDDDGTLHRPPDWADDHPVAGIPFASAEAFAAHRAEALGRPCRLPTDEEWEKAARGADQRTYPWGSAFDPCLAHTHDALPDGPRPGPVGAFPTDRSVFGVEDLAGGVREWTRTRATRGGRVVRGGCWADDARGARLATRREAPDTTCDLRLGFRLVVPAAVSEEAEAIIF